MQKVKDEKMLLEAELQALEQATSCAEASKQIMSFVAGASKPDAFENQSDNEWVKSGDAGGACCVIS